MSADQGTLFAINQAECLELLGTRTVGRLVIVVAGEPDVFPVNYTLDSGDVIFRTDAGLKFTQSALRRIAFEVDEIDEARREGWSVVIKGTGIKLNLGSIDGSNTPLASLDPWPAGTKQHAIRIVPRVISGRRITRA